MSTLEITNIDTINKIMEETKATAWFGTKNYSLYDIEFTLQISGITCMSEVTQLGEPHGRSFVNAIFLTFKDDADRLMFLMKVS